MTDQSPGAKGTPAIADANMQAWMEYLYEQQAMPTNAKGVEVTLTAIDPNGNTHIGTATSDTSGTSASRGRLRSQDTTLSSPPSQAPNPTAAHFRNPLVSP